MLKKAILLSCLSVSMTAYADHETGHVDVKIGPLTPRAAAGQVTFNQYCAACHGVNGQGTKVGPPLIHDIYNPGHHDNASFMRAVKNGVQQHHWPYGNMPPQPQTGFTDMTNLMAFIREVQEQNGIYRKAHTM
ncbi:c-type cytochrome [Gynuella sunshinyii]|uniref:Cytochrome c2 n=1 Tax=Gynuella sunshinyii YC6258 TaxID=1445510 RepID=A0A0C5VDQ6_9GAMM|nr:c-type cytochrome [Gynuella sunshinyii]AJQ97460.1 cytochrome c2 [Gynuella sunshinyii YC6258]